MRDLHAQNPASWTSCSEAGATADPQKRSVARGRKVCAFAVIIDAMFIDASCLLHDCVSFKCKTCAVNFFFFFFRLLFRPSHSSFCFLFSWNCFPYIKTVYHSSYFGARFQLEVESMIVDDDRGEHPNALNLSPEVLAVRKIDYIDIVADENQEGGYDAKENPGKFKSKVTNRGPLSANFYKDCTPVMCVYKVVTCKCEFGPFQNKAESVCLSAGMRDLLLPFHRQIFCWIDDWFNMTMEQIKAFEHEVQTKLNALPFKKEQSAKLADNASVEVVEKDQQMLSRASLAKEGKDETGNNNNNNNDSGRKSPAKK